MRISLFALPSLLFACAHEPGPLTPAPPASPAPVKVAPTPSAAPPVATASSAVPRLPAKAPLLAVSLAKPSAASPFQKQALPKPRRIASGGLLKPGVPGPDRIVIETLSREGALIDAENAQVVARFPQPRTVSPRAGVVVLDSRTPELVRLSDGERVRPVLEPEPGDAKSLWLAASPKHERVVVLVESRDGSASVGVSKDRSFESFSRVPLPFTPSVAPRGLIPSDDRSWHFLQNSRELGAGGTPWFLDHDSECRRAQLGAEGKVRCIEYGPGAFMGGPRWLSAGWVVNDQLFAHSSWSGSIAGHEELVGEGPCSATLTLAEPPRAYLQCARSSALVAPDAVLEVSGAPRVSGLLGADVGAVVPLIATEDGVESAELWLDLARKKLWRSERVRPLAIAAFAGVHEIALAVRADEKEVLVLDFAKGLAESLGSVDDCPGQLAELRELEPAKRPRFLVLACLTPPPKHSVSQNHIWSEVVDLASRVRFRSKLLPELVFDDGLVVLSTRRRLSAESKDAPGEISSARLP